MFIIAKYRLLFQQTIVMPKYHCQTCIPMIYCKNSNSNNNLSVIETTCTKRIGNWWILYKFLKIFTALAVVLAITTTVHFCHSLPLVVEESGKPNSMDPKTNPSTKLDAKISLIKPSLEELATTLNEILQTNFANVNVSVVDCPDLTSPPFNIVSKGLGGSPRLVDVGGNGNFYPVIKKTVYNLKDICKTAELPECLVIGPGAGPQHLLGFNAEFVHNTHIIPSSNNQSKFGSYIIYVKEQTAESPNIKRYFVRQLTNSTAQEFIAMGQLLLTEGKPRKVLKIVAEKRTGQENFVTHIRLGLAQKYGNRPVGLGGVTLITHGKIKMHVMPELPNQPFESKEAIDNWLVYFDMEAPLTCTTYIVSHDPGLDLRTEHTHCYSDHGDGGHYHYDITPDTVRYEAYFTPAEYLYRIDRVSY